MENTRDLSKFGYREIKETAKLLLNAYVENKGNFDLGDGVALEFNPNSGNVFLTDEDCNVAMMNGEDLDMWFSCPICGHEGFIEDMQHNEENKECQEYVKEIQERYKNESE